MTMRGSRALRPFLCAAAFAWLQACGGAAPPPPKVVAVPPASTAVATEPPPPAVSGTRPANVVAWVHLENLQAWMLYVGLNQDKKPGEELMKGLAEGLEVVDISRPFNAAVTLVGEDDGEMALSIPIKDKQRFLDAVSKSADVTERKSRYVITEKKKEPAPDDGSGTPAPPADPPKKKSKIDEKTFACDFVASPPTAVCGSDRGLTEMGPWLRSNPRPQKGDLALQLYAAPARELMLSGLKKLQNDGTTAPDAQSDPEAQRKKAEDDLKAYTNLGDLVRELDGFGMTASLRDSNVEFGMTVSFQGVESAWVKPVFQSPPGLSKPDLLFKLTENASAAFYSQGGGPVPELLSSYDFWQNLTGADHDKGAAWTAEVRKLMSLPYGAAYGVDIQRVTAALAAFKSAKDPDKAKKALADAVDGYGLVAASTDVASAQRLVREGMRLGQLEHKNQVALNPDMASYDHATSAVRVAPTGLGLPKGSFFLDETNMVEAATPSTPGKGVKPAVAKKKKQVKTSALFFGDAQNTFMLFGLSDDRAYATTAKEILTRKASPRTLDPLLTQKGFILGGQVTSFIGAFSTHEYSLKDQSKLDKAAKDKLVLDLEHDLSAPRLAIPFALSTSRSGAGGALAFDVKGDKAAFSTIFSHALEGVGAGALLMLPLMLAMMGATP